MENIYFQKFRTICMLNGYGTHETACTVFAHGNLEEGIKSVQNKLSMIVSLHLFPKTEASSICS